MDWSTVLLNLMLVRSSHAPSLAGARDKHYICSLWWRYGDCSACQPLVLDSTAQQSDNPPRPQFLQGAVDRVQVGEEGSCTDETQRNVWQALLNALVVSPDATQQIW